MPTMPHLPALMLAVLVSIAATLDMRTRRIPNSLTLAGIAAGLAVGVSDGRAMESLAGMGLALAVYVPLFALGAMGGGDVKLMAAVGAFAGPAVWLRMFIITALTGGVIALIFVARKRAVAPTIRNIGFIFEELSHGRPPSRQRPDLSITSERALTLPHGVSIALGVISYLLLVQGNPKY
jgi:prepilin peptidase CpaA